jgi:hypothetical protein
VYTADPNEEPGTQVPVAGPEKLEEQLRETQEKLAQLEKLGARQISMTDPESRFLHETDGFALGYTADLPVSEDHLIVAQRTTQAVSDSESLLPLVDQVKQICGAWPQEAAPIVAFSRWPMWRRWKLVAFWASFRMRI